MNAKWAYTFLCVGLVCMMVLSACQESTSTSQQTSQMAVSKTGAQATLVTPSTLSSGSTSLSETGSSTPTMSVTYTPLTINHEKPSMSICGEYTLTPTVSTNDNTPTISISKNGEPIKQLDDSGMSAYQAFCDGTKPLLYRQFWGGLKGVYALLDWDKTWSERISECIITYSDTEEIVDIALSQTINGVATAPSNDKEICQKMQNFPQSGDIYQEK